MLRTGDIIMNWKLIFLLSLFGVAIAVVSLFGLSKPIEMSLWLVIFIFYAIMIVKYTHGKYFLHGLLVSLFNGIWIAVIHSACFDMYIANNPEQAEMAAQFPPSIPPQMMMMIIGPLVGLIFGVVAGLFAVVAGKIMKKNPPTEVQT